MRKLWASAMLAALLAAPSISFACPACRDITAGSAPQMRAGIRKGIIVLGIPAGAVFLGILGVAWKMKPQAEERDQEETSIHSL